MTSQNAPNADILLHSFYSASPPEMGTCSLKFEPMSARCKEERYGYESQSSPGACLTTPVSFKLRNQWVPVGAAFRDHY